MTELFIFMLQILKNRKNEPFHAQMSAEAAKTTDLDSMLQELESRHVQEIVRVAHDLNVQHAKELEAKRKELEAKDLRIENVVATLGKVLKEREYLKNELQRAGHQQVIMKMKSAASNERDMLKSIRDQIIGKPSPALQDRSMQTMDVLFADDRDPDDDDAPAAASSAAERDSRKPSPAGWIDAVHGEIKGDIAAAFKNIYESDAAAAKAKKKPKSKYDWSFMDVDAFAKEALKQGMPFDTAVADITLPKEWLKSLKVAAKAVSSVQMRVCCSWTIESSAFQSDDSRGRILSMRVLLKASYDENAYWYSTVLVCACNFFCRDR
jgi:hypothetical protein